MKLFKTLLTLSVSLTILFSCEGEDYGGNEFNSDVSGQGGSLARYAIANGYMYFLETESITVYSLSNPESPEVIKTVPTDNSNVETIFSYGDYLYLGTPNGLEIFNIEDGANPYFVSTANHVRGCDPVVADSNYAYVTVRNSPICGTAEEENILEIFDTEDPENPVSVSITQLEYPIGLAIDGDILFVCDDSLKIFDVSDRMNPSHLKSYESNSYDVIINGNNVVTVSDDGIKQYLYDRENITISLASSFGF